jgi:hypothetical protein
LKQDGNANLKHTTDMKEATESLPRAPKEIKLSPIDEVKFWSRIDKNGPTMPHMDSPCWIWTAGKFARGYGSFKVAGIANRTHRVAWVLANGQIPDGLHALHRCDVRACCRADHLFLGTNADNVRDRESKGRGNCLKGEAHNQAKLTVVKVAEIRALYAAGGITQCQLAKQFDVTQATISNILLHKIWAK